MNIRKTISLVIALLIFPFLTQAEDLKDPLYRDEDISASIINVSINTLPNGFYEYIYHLSFPPENKGQVLTFELDLSCDLDFGNITFPEPSDPSVTDSSQDGAYVPVQIYDAQGTLPPGISPRNTVVYPIVGGYPDSPPLELRLISPASPAPRKFELQPYMDTTGWDYPELEEHPEIPWVDDFTVKGMIDGPACDTSKPAPAFAGSKRGFETDETNQLLTYRQPTRNRWHAAPGEDSFTLDILYSDMMDPKSFKATPGWARKYFNPAPGTEESVVLPLGPGINKFKLEARTDKSTSTGAGRPDFSEKDMDEFEIRLPSNGKGQDKK